MAFVSGFLVSITGPNVRSVLQNVCAPEVRGTAFAVFALTDDLGKGFGPFLVYGFIDAFHGDRQAAYSFIIMFWLICGVLLLAMYLTLEKDISDVQQAIRQAIELHDRDSTEGDERSQAEREAETVAETEAEKQQHYNRGREHRVDAKHGEVEASRNPLWAELEGRQTSPHSLSTISCFVNGYFINIGGGVEERKLPAL
jgi:hypothetical protein